MIQMATSKGVLLWQVGLLGEFGMPAAMIIENPDSRGETSEYKCVVCRSKNCNHLTCLMKSLGLASSKGKFPVRPLALSMSINMPYTIESIKIIVVSGPVQNKTNHLALVVSCIKRFVPDNVA